MDESHLCTTECFVQLLVFKLLDPFFFCRFNEAERTTANLCVTLAAIITRKDPAEAFSTDHLLTYVHLGRVKITYASWRDGCLYNFPTFGENASQIDS